MVLPLIKRSHQSSTKKAFNCSISSRPYPEKRFSKTSCIISLKSTSKSLLLLKISRAPLSSSLSQKSKTKLNKRKSYLSSIGITGSTPQENSLLSSISPQLNRTSQPSLQKTTRLVKGEDLQKISNHSFSLVKTRN